jgi:hypothetical protein
MTAKPKKPYEVGYGKPPKATQFQKGKSGNPAGKPKKVAPEFDPGKVLQAIDNEELILPIDGKRKRMTRAEIQLRQLSKTAIKGDLAAMRLMVTMASEHSGPGENAKYSLECISETEAARRFGRNWKRRVEEHNTRVRGWK